VSVFHLSCPGISKVRTNELSMKLHVHPLEGLKKRATVTNNPSVLRTVPLPAMELVHPKKPLSLWHTGMAEPIRKMVCK
jgi:hypothetical protein